MRRYSEFANEGSLFGRFNSDPGAVFEFYDAIKRNAYLQPEKRLLLALLGDALKCFQKHHDSKSGRGRRLFVETEQWFSAENEEDIFSFELVCITLGMNPGFVRRMLEKWSTGARRPAPSLTRANEKSAQAPASGHLKHATQAK
jgi:hypothetical protein